MYVGISKKEELDHRQMLICRCPEWNEEGYQIAQYDKHTNEIWYTGQANDDFESCILAFAKLNENGEIIKF